MSISVLSIAQEGKENKMVYQIENQNEVDPEWDGIEYRIPNKTRLKRERQAYEEAEREDREDGEVL